MVAALVPQGYGRGRIVTQQWTNRQTKALYLVSDRLHIVVSLLTMETEPVSEMLVWSQE